MHVHTIISMFYSTYNRSINFEMTSSNMRHGVVHIVYCSVVWYIKRPRRRVLCFGWLFRCFITPFVLYIFLPFIIFSAYTHTYTLAHEWFGSRIPVCWFYCVRRCVNENDHHKSEKHVYYSTKDYHTVHIRKVSAAAATELDMDEWKQRVSLLCFHHYYYYRSITTFILSQ